MEAKIEITVISNVVYKVEVTVNDETIHKYSPLEKLSLSIRTLSQILPKNALISNENDILEEIQTSAKALKRFYKKETSFLRSL